MDTPPDSITPAHMSTYACTEGIMHVRTYTDTHSPEVTIISQNALALSIRSVSRKGKRYMMHHTTPSHTHTHAHTSQRLCIVVHESQVDGFSALAHTY